MAFRANQQAVSRPTTNGSKSLGAMYSTQQEMLLHYPPPVSCECNKRFSLKIYRGYAEGLARNIEVVREQLIPEYDTIRRQLAATIANNNYRSLVTYIDQLTSLLGTARIDFGPALSQPPTQASASAVVGLINAVNTVTAAIPGPDQYEGLRTSTNPFQQYQYQLYSNLNTYAQPLVAANADLTKWYEQWVQGGAQAAPLDAVERGLTRIRMYLEQQRSSIPVTVTQPFTRADAENAVRDLESRGQLMLGRLNDALFTQLGLERGCCRDIVADAVRRGLVDEDYPPINEETAYRPHLWPPRVVV